MTKLEKTDQVCKLDGICSIVGLGESIEIVLMVGIIVGIIAKHLPIWNWVMIVNHFWEDLVWVNTGGSDRKSGQRWCCKIIHTRTTTSLSKVKQINVQQLPLLQLPSTFGLMDVNCRQFLGVLTFMKGWVWEHFAKWVDFDIKLCFWRLGFRMFAELGIWHCVWIEWNWIECSFISAAIISALCAQWYNERHCLWLCAKPNARGWPVFQLVDELGQSDSDHLSAWKWREVSEKLAPS